jgi:hypothetical protein
MGMSYKIDQERRVVLTRGWGVLSTQNLQDVMSHILLDPRFDPRYRSLADLTEVTSVTVDVMEVAHTASTPLYVAGTRRAIVASSDAVFGMARMFASFAERAGQEVNVFRDMQAAEAWLEL